MDNEGNKIVVSETSSYDNVEALVEGKRQADNYIAELQAQLKENKEALEAFTNQASIIEELKSMNDQKDTQGAATNQPAENQEQKQEIDLTTIKSLIAEAEKQKEADALLNSFKANLGDSFEAVVTTKAADLNMTKDELVALSRTHPALFKQTMGALEPKTQAPAMTYKASGSQAQPSTSTQTVDPNSSRGLINQIKAVKGKASVDLYTKLAKQLESGDWVNPSDI